MDATTHERFDLSALRERAGVQVFARGETYWRNGQVTLISLDGERAVAQVSGEAEYRTVLRGRGRDFDGDCSCVAFQNYGFCKHLVAVGLAANAAGPAGESEGAGTLTHLREHLKSKGVDHLADLVLDLASRDAALYDRIEVSALAMEADDRVLEKRLTRAIDKATKTGDFVEYRDVPGWARSVEAVLEALDDIATGPRAAIGMKLALHTLQRLEQAIEAIDDSAGYGGALMMRARDVHAKAAAAAKPNPVGLARNVFRLQMDDAYGVLHDAHVAYAKALGEAGLAEYRKLAQEAWRALPARGPARRREIYFDAKGDTLERILDWFLERDGDVDGRIALRAKNLSSQYRYVELISFCQAQGREKEALARTEEALWQFEDEQPDERLTFLAARLLEGTGRAADAEAAVRRAFEKAPSLGYYARLKKLGGETAGRSAISFLEKWLGKGRAGDFNAASDLLTRIITYEKDFTAAWRVVKDHGASRQTVVALAEASEAAHPAEALDVYAREVEDLVRTGGNESYEAAAARVAHMAMLRPVDAQRRYVDELREGHKRKRNFMKLLA